ncbi:hypothetical protein P1J78_11375 [Psychromarinibacter sp. C21-152]|uniref:Uncharacterized protein n=1 Tax=Psychromarinibacter sediminicola TaxID=3033385 RepID=A0AAE3NPV9_9RHOB|nr:hypothetical protein [Psychromarinibacter sediminicola]MDF0601333.1 hypothetical protein [Psychromarinibacter sediminicola]
MTARHLLQGAALSTLFAGAAMAVESGWTAGKVAGVEALLPSPQDEAAAGSRATAGTAEIDGAEIMDKVTEAALVAPQRPQNGPGPTD